MKIIYTITNEDIVKFNIQHLSKLSRIKRVQKKNKVIISSLYIAIAIAWFICKPSHWPMAWILLFLGTLWYFFYPKVWERRMVKKINKIFKDKPCKAQELEFRPNGIWAKSDSYRGEIPWNAIERVVENKNYLFLYLSEEDAIIIPRSEVESGVDWEELLDCIKEFFEREWEIESV